MTKPRKDAMIRYKMSPRLLPKQRGGTGKNRKPLYGSKKYDKAFLKCSHRTLLNPKRAKNEKAIYEACGKEFFVSKKGVRFCEEHAPHTKQALPKKGGNVEMRKALKVLGLL